MNGYNESSRTTVRESGRSIRLAQGGVSFDKDRLPSENGTLDIVGHGSPDGKRLGGRTAAQLAKVLEESGITQLKTLNLKSCYSEAFAQELVDEIAKLNQAGAQIQIEQITGAKGPIAIDRATGKSITPQEVEQGVQHDGFLDLTDEQQEVVTNLFSSAYDTATFRRKAFSGEDRISAWNYQVQAECAALELEPPSPHEVSDTLQQMGLTVKGIHLRHMIPYSDIAGLMRVATSDTTENRVGTEFRDQVRNQVSRLMGLIAPEHQHRWDAIKENPGLLSTSGGRAEIRSLYLILAHSQMNLFQGGGSVNSSISNRPDFSVHTSGLIHGDHALALAQWHHDTMLLLGLSPSIQEVTVACRIGDQEGHLTTQVMQHDLSRHMHGKIYANTLGELELELPRLYDPGNGGDLPPRFVMPPIHFEPD